MSYSAILWSGVSVTLLICFVAVILFVHKRYRFNMVDAYTEGNYPTYDLNKNKVTVSQVKSAKFFLVVALMFFVQVMLGALLAHYYFELVSFFVMIWILYFLPFGTSKGYDF